MNLISKLFAGQIKREVNQQSQQIANLYNRSVFRWLGKDQPIFLNDNPNTYIEEGYMGTAAVYECISLRTDKLKACPIIIYEIKEGGEQKAKEFKNLYYSDTIEARAKSFVIKSQVLTETNLPEIQKILDKPNSKQDIGDIIENLVGCYDLLGNSYLYKNGPNPEQQMWSEIFVLPANRIHILSGGMFDPVQGYVMDYQSDREQMFPSDQVDHMKTFNPLSTTVGSQLYGMPPLRPYLNQLANDKMGNAEIAKQIKNGGTFGLLSPKNEKDVFNDKQQQALIERLKEAKMSKDEVERIFPGSIAMDWTQIGLPLADLAVMEVLKVGREDIYRCFKIPLSFSNQDAATFNNVDADNKRLVYNSIAPIARKVSDTLTRALCDPVSKRTGKKYMILVDYNSLPEMAADMAKIAEWLDKCWDLTPNEKREAKGWGKSTEKGMDQIWVPGSVRPMSDAVISEEAFNNANNNAAEL